mgnify:CR=1 FL=1|jgi:hypothetical protein|tara:strand:+ start:201 stop:446 length:246 start_codon:yes stop_codon:yes gene_type:complete
MEKQLIVDIKNKTIERVSLSDTELQEIQNARAVAQSTILSKEEQLEVIKKEKANKKNGNTKLLGLGLTQEEATALTGYTPE